METLVSDEGNGRTVLGRIMPLSVVVKYWTCPKCGEPNAVSLSLPLDLDRPIVTAYENTFGPADELTLKALAVLNNQAISDFGEDWQQKFQDNAKSMIVGVVNIMKEQYGDEWAEALIEVGVSFVKHGEE
jgi:hypothetical protein